MKRSLRSINFILMFVLCFGALGFMPKSVAADSTAQTLPFSQNWNNIGLITTSDNWSGVPGIVGYRGDNLTSANDVDPQTVLAPDSPGVLDVNANQTNPNTFSTGGVTEFHLTDPVVALTGSGTADAPYLLLNLDTSNQKNIQVSYNVRDLDGSIDNAAQQVALHYRIGSSGNFTNIPAGYISDATTGPSLSTLVTPVSVTLPSAADNQPLVQLRIMTTNASGNDEWVGIDDILISGVSTDAAPTVSSTSPLDGATGVPLSAVIEIVFSEPVTVTDPWFTLSCNGTSKAATANDPADDTTFTITPSTPFEDGDECEVVITAANVVDQDGITADSMTTDFSFSFIAGDFAPSVVNTTPANAATGVPIDANISVTFSEKVNVSNRWFNISCSSSGNLTDSATVNDAGDPVIVIDPGIDFVRSEVCTVTIFASGVSDDDANDPPNNMAADYTFSFTATNCGTPFTPIPQIQGDGAVTPLLNTVLTTEGIVVGDFQTDVSVSGTKNGFYLQALAGDGNPATSDGIFIYSTKVDVHVGDRVRVTGKAAEYTTGSGSLTQLTSVSSIELCSIGNYKAPTVLSLPVTSDFQYEAYEGMLVTYPQELFISEYFNFDRYGEIVLTSERHITPTAEFEPGSPEALQAVQDYLLDKITLDDGRTSQNPDPALHPNGGVFDLTNLFRGGSTVANVTGILDFYQSLYRLQPTVGATYTDSNPRTPMPDGVGGDIKVASFNVLNYFTTIDAGPDICGPLANLDCRGADSQAEFDRQVAKILSALSAIDADVIGLMEIENDRHGQPADYAVADLVTRLNAKAGADIYDYIPTGAIGTDAIKVALLYKPASLTPVGETAILTTLIDPRFIDTFNRPVLAQSFMDSDGGVFTVAVNHLKSKSMDDDGLCDPDLGQGACNLVRKAAAEAMMDWLASFPTGYGDEDFLIIGDLNAYDKEDPIVAIKLGADDTDGTGDDYSDMIFDILGEGAYGYVYDGQVGYLDHALSSTDLYNEVIGLTIWHINADEADLIDYNMDFKLPAQDAIYAPDAYRSSDHDPVIVGLTLNHSPLAYQDKAFETAEDTLLVVPVEESLLINDMDPQSLPLTADLVSDAGHGVVTINPDGSFSYLPDLDFFGEDSFTYRAFNGTEYSNIITITITVLPVNDSPVAVDDLYETDQDVALVVPVPGVLDNDSDPDPSDMFTVLLMTPTQHGTVVLQADGSFTYTPAPGFSGTDTFTYALISLVRGGYADTATVTITVHPVYRYFLPLILK